MLDRQPDHALRQPPRHPGVAMQPGHGGRTRGPGDGAAAASPPLSAPSSRAASHRRSVRSPSPPSVPCRPARHRAHSTAIPAGIDGFRALKGLAEIGGAGETWTLMFGSIGAIVIGATAWVRVAALAGPADEAPTVSCAS